VHIKFNNLPLKQLLVNIAAGEGPAWAGTSTFAGLPQGPPLFSFFFLEEAEDCGKIELDSVMY
jgi:hypothetical protein